MSPQHAQPTTELDFLVNVVAIKVLSLVQFNRTSTRVIFKGKLLAVVSNYRESGAGLTKNSFLFFSHKNSSSKLYSKIIFTIKF